MPTEGQVVGVYFGALVVKSQHGAFQTQFSLNLLISEPHLYELGSHRAGQRGELEMTTPFPWHLRHREAVAGVLGRR